MGNWKAPADLKYTRSDEWIRVEGDSGTIGLTDYAQDQLNDLVYVEMPDAGDSLDQGESFGTIESVKAAADMHMPVGGTVTDTNSELEDEPELANSDPYGKGWVIKITIANAAELDGLMDAKAYAEFCNSRE